MRITLLAASAALALSACSNEPEQQTSQPDPELTDSALATAAPSGPASASAAPSPAASGADAEAADTSIPQGMRGRWGVNLADCNGDAAAKGLMVIDAKTIRFYESIAAVGTVRQRSAAKLDASWNYEGEGMTWQRDMTLTLGSGGNALIKEEFGSDAPTGPYTYKRCN